MGNPNAKRNREIIAFAKANDWSYGLIAFRFGVTRNVVAGLMFRQRHPYSTLVDKYGERTHKRNKIGTGYRTGPPATYNEFNSR